MSVTRVLLCLSADTPTSCQEGLTMHRGNGGIWLLASPFPSLPSIGCSGPEIEDYFVSDIPPSEEGQEGNRAMCPSWHICNQEERNAAILYSFIAVSRLENHLKFWIIINCKIPLGNPSNKCCVYTASKNRLFFSRSGVPFLVAEQLTANTLKTEIKKYTSGVVF